MRQLIGEVVLVAIFVVSLVTLVVGLIMVHPGLALAVGGLAGLLLGFGWIRRDRPFPEVRAETEQRDSREDDPDDDGRMEVRPL